MIRDEESDSNNVANESPRASPTRKAVGTDGTISVLSPGGSGKQA